MCQVIEGDELRSPESAEHLRHEGVLVDLSCSVQGDDGRVGQGLVQLVEHVARVEGYC